MEQSVNKKQYYLNYIKENYIDNYKRPKQKDFIKDLNEINYLFGSWTNFLIESGIKPRKCIVEKDIENRKNNYIKIIQEKYKELGRIPKFAEVESDKRAMYLRSYINHHRWNDLVKEALGFSKESRNSKFENLPIDELINILKNELTIMKSRNLRYSFSLIFNRNRTNGTPCASTYTKLLNKTWKDILLDLDLL